MKKIWQKSLASMVSAALCLTAFVGCLTVSAEKGSATITVGSNSAKPGAEVVIPVTINANTNPDVAKIDGVAVALFDLQFDTTNLTVTGVSAPAEAAYCAEAKCANGEEIYVDPTTNSIKVLATSKDNSGQFYPLDFASMTVNVTFKIKDTAVAGELPVKIFAAQACDAGTKTETTVDNLIKYEYADNEDFINLVTVDGSVTVASSHTHTWKFVSGTPAISNGANGVINFRCACGETKTVNDVTYLAASTLQAPDIGCTATTQLILKASVTKYADATAGYVTVTHHFADGTPDSVEVLDIKDAKKEDGYYKWIIGVNSKNFTDSFTTAFFTERNGSWVSGAKRDFSIKSAAMSAINSAQSSEVIKKTAANLLTMGSKVQSRFPYATDNLADSELVGDLANYVTNTTPVVAKTNENFARDNTGVTNGEKLGFGNPSVSLADSISINFNIVTKYYDLSSLSNLKLVATYTSYNGGYVTSDVTKYTTNTSGQYVFSFEVTAPNMRVPVTIQLFDGDTPVSNCATYSVEGVIAHALSSDASLSEVVYSIMNYSDAAVEAFQ